MKRCRIFAPEKMSGRTSGGGGGGGVMFGTFVVVVVLVTVFSIMTFGFSVSIWNRVQHNDIINSGKRVFLDGASCPDGEDRRRDAYNKRELIAYREYARGVPCHTNNGDEAAYLATRAGSFSKVKFKTLAIAHKLLSVFCVRVCNF